MQDAISPVTPSTSGCRVLLVDDNADAREATAQLMRSIGYDVTEAGDGDSALSSAVSRVPDVIIMDLGLPIKSGYIVAAELKGMPSLRHVPLVALSGYGQPADRAASSAAGFAEHLVKPVSIDELARVVETQVGL
jgi:CheY-like chemotaxis protein